MERGALGDRVFVGRIRIVFLSRHWEDSVMSNALDDYVSDTEIDLSPCVTYVTNCV